MAGWNRSTTITDGTSAATPSHTRRWLLAIAATAAAVVGGAVGRHYWQTEPLPKIGGYVLSEPRALPPVALVDEQGRAFSTADFVGRWSFLYFGYTHCPDVCPLTLVELARVKKTLAEQLPDTPTDYYLVSVDPARDTPEHLQEYVRYFDASFHGLTASIADLKLLAEQTGSVFFVPEAQSADDYLVSHSSNVVLLGPDGHLVAVFTSPHDPAQLAADFGRVAAYYARR